MRCEEVGRVLPQVVDVEAGAEVFDLDVQRHIDSCLRCQAEVTRYRRMLRGLHQLRASYVEPSPGLLAQTLAVLDDADEHRAVRALLKGRRLAYAGAIGGAAVAAVATAVVLAGRSRRRASALAAAG